MFSLQNTAKKLRWGRFLFLMLLLLITLLGLVCLVLQNGTPTLSVPDLAQVLFAGEGDRLTRVAIFGLRIPRLVLGLLAGAMLALAGVLLQETLRNAIAGPELLGVSTGASAVMAVVMLLAIPIPLVFIPWLTLVGGTLSGTVVLLSVRRVTDPVRVALVGAALSALLQAFIIVLVSLGTESGVTLLFFFLLGSMANRTWEHVQLILPWAVLCIPLALLTARTLNVLQLGDEIAEGLGIHVQRWRWLLLLLATGLITSVVAVSGPIAFVSLLAPHIARRLIGAPDTRFVLPLSAFLGSFLLVGADLVARLVFAPSETPVGMWTTLLGGPVLLLLLRRRLRKGL